MYYVLTNSVSSNVAIACLLQQKSIIVGSPVKAMSDLLAQRFPVYIFVLLSVNLFFLPAPFLDVLHFKFKFAIV